MVGHRTDIGKVVGKIALREFPDDVQQLIQDWTDHTGHSVDWDRVLTVYATPVEVFPETEGDTRERGDAYIDAMDLATAPPVLISGRYWADGWHRVEKARRCGVPTVRTADLAEIGSKYADVLGELELPVTVTEAGARSIIESYADEDAEEDEKMRRAEEYFNIGNHNARNNWSAEDEMDEPEADWCWMWDGGLRVAQGISHSLSFGYDRVGRFKGWFDVESGVLSFVDEQQRVQTPDEIPAQLFAHLKRRFNPKTIKVF